MSGVGLLRSRSLRRMALVVAISIAAVMLIVRLRSLSLDGQVQVGTKDFLIYWSGARLVLDGGNPYDLEALVATEQAAGVHEPDAHLLGLWNPPWTLALLLPVSALPLGVASGIWLLVQFGLILVSGLLLWRLYAPGDKGLWIGLVLAAGFVPGLYGLRMGQLSAWLLLGVVGFLSAGRARRDILAGAALALLTVKPHVTYLFWPAALWWAVAGRRWRILAGWAAALAGASLTVAAFAPSIFADYAGAASAPPIGWAPPTIGSWLRVLFAVLTGTDRRFLQFVPTVTGVACLLVWLVRQRGPWDWGAVAAPLLLLSPPTAVYGWTYDQIVILPAVFVLVTRTRRRRPPLRAGMLGVLLATQVGLGTSLALSVAEFFNLWHPMALAALYWWSDYAHGRASACPARPRSLED